MSDLIDVLVSEVLSKGQIKDLPENLILYKINKFFLTNGDIRKKLEKEFEVKGDKIVRSKLFKEVVKRIREEIGVVYGSFLTKDFGKKEKFLDKENYLEILKLHKSTRERFDFYNEVYSKIFDWFKPKKIGDLACGLNPVSYFIMKDVLEEDVKYFASDLNPSDMAFLNLFFEKTKINGVARDYDLTTLDFLEDKNFLDCDLVFLFKALDSLEFAKRNVSKKILEGIRANHIVVSFPTKSLVSKKEFKSEKRNWFVNFLDRMDYKYEEFEIENEQFFLIKK